MTQSKLGHGRPRVLIVGMLDSSHVAAWIQSVACLDYEIHLFPSSPHRRVHPTIRELLNSPEVSLHLSRFLRLGSLAIWAFDQFRVVHVRRHILQRFMKKINPHLVHALEFQHAAYLVDSATAFKHRTFYVTNYGSDIYWFRRSPRHAERIRNVLRHANFYSAECHRDVQLALEFGFSGHVFPVVPNAGGIPQSMFDQIPQVPPSERSVIAVKGYTNFVGRAQIALRALVVLRRQIEQYTIVVYSATTRARLIATWMRLRYQIRIEAIPKFRLSRDEVVKLMNRAALYIGVSDSDGLSTSMIEALSCGTYVIQSGTSCCEEVINDPKQGSVLSENTVSAVCEAIGVFLRQRDQRDIAAHESADRVRSLFDSKVLSQQARDCYRLCLATPSGPN